MGCLRILGWVVLFFAVLWGALHLPLVSVRSIRIAESSTADQGLRAEVLSYVTSRMEEYSYGVKGSTRYFFKKDTVSDMVRDTFLKVESVDITSEFFNTWVVTLTGRKTFGTHCEDRGACHLIDPFGIVFSRTTLPVGIVIQMPDAILLGSGMFGEGASAKADFSKVADVVRFLEQYGLVVDEVAIRQDSRVVHLLVRGGVGVWIDASESLYDTTRSLYVVFEEVFPGDDRNSLVSVDVRNPLSILYEKR